MGSGRRRGRRGGAEVAERFVVSPGHTQLARSTPAPMRVLPGTPARAFDAVDRRRTRRHRRHAVFDYRAVLVRRKCGQGRAARKPVSVWVRADRESPNRWRGKVERHLDALTPSRGGAGRRTMVTVDGHADAFREGLAVAVRVSSIPALGGRHA